MTDDKLIWITAENSIPSDEVDKIRDHLQETDATDGFQFIISHEDIEPISKDEVRKMLNEL